MSDSVIHFLKSIKCSNPFFPNISSHLVTVDKDAKIMDAFQKIINHKILSVPVVDKNSMPVAVFSMLDLTNHFVNMFKEEDLKGMNSKRTFDLFSSWIDLKEKRNELLHEKVSEVLHKELTQMEILDPMCTIEEGASLFDAITMLVDSKARRALVCHQETGKLTGVITQSRLLEFIGLVQHSLNEEAQTVEYLNLGTKEVVTVRDTDMSIRAFTLMKEKKISAVAVVNEQGKLVGNMSSDDLKLVGYDFSYFTYLAGSVNEYLSWTYNTELAHSRFTIRNQIQQKTGEPILVTCTKSNTLGFVIRTLNYYRVHRLYIVDEGYKPIGVISIHDVLEKIIKNRS